MKQTTRNAFYEALKELPKNQTNRTIHLVVSWYFPELHTALVRELRTDKYTGQQLFDYCHPKHPKACRTCQKPAKFLMWTTGYVKYCGPKCRNRDPEFQARIAVIGKTRRAKTKEAKEAKAQAEYELKVAQSEDIGLVEVWSKIQSNRNLTTRFYHWIKSNYPKAHQQVSQLVGTETYSLQRFYDACFPEAVKICETCGKLTPFNVTKRAYRKFCNSECYYQDPNRRERYRLAYLKKTGGRFEFPNQDPEIHKQQKLRSDVHKYTVSGREVICQGNLAIHVYKALADVWGSQEIHSEFHEEYPKHLAREMKTTPDIYVQPLDLFIEVKSTYTLCGNQFFFDTAKRQYLKATKAYGMQAIRTVLAIQPTKLKPTVIFILPTRWYLRSLDYMQAMVGRLQKQAVTMRKSMLTGGSMVIDLGSGNRVNPFHS